MLRENLVARIKRAVLSCEYNFYHGFQYRIDNEHITAPAVWLLPSELLQVEGRNEGYYTYKVRMHIMHDNKKYTEDQKEMIWSLQEQALISITNNITRSDNILFVSDIKAEAAEFALANTGTISIKAEFKVKIYFCDESKKEK